ncbi:MAG: mercuric transport protein MerT [Deferrisomatales bacterium]
MAGGVVAGLLASACCIGPLAAVFLGITGAGALARWEPYRPYFGALMVAFLALGFYRTYRKPESTGAACASCCTSGRRRLRKIALWVATAVALALYFVPNLLGLGLE